MSLDRFNTLLTFVPEATSTSYIVTVGPRWESTTFASTPNVVSVCASASITPVSWTPSLVEGGAVRSRSSEGSSYGPAAVVTVRGLGAFFAGSPGSSAAGGSSSGSTGEDSGRTTTGSSTRPMASMNFARFLGSLGLAAASAGAASRAAAFSALAAAFASLAVFATSSFSTRLERKSDTFCLASANDVPVKMSRPIAARPASITKAP